MFTHFSHFVPLLTALTLCVTACGTLSHPRSPTPEPLKLKAMTFNIRCDLASDGPNRWEPRRAWVADFIRRAQCDFIGIQEARTNQRADLDRLLAPTYLSLGVPRGPDGEGTPLYYLATRWQLDPQQHGNFWLSDTPQIPGSMTWGNSYPRMVTWGRFIERSSGRSITVFNTHFDHQSDTARQKSARLILQHIAQLPPQEPVLVTGDLNSSENALALATFTGKQPTSANAPTLLDTFRAVHPDLSADAACTFHAFLGTPTSLGKIDYIFTRPNAHILSSEIIHEHYLSFDSTTLNQNPISQNHGERYLSDHFPLTAEISCP